MQLWDGEILDAPIVIEILKLAKLL